MNIRVEKPILAFTTKSGKELYLDPLTNELTSRELAFANFEGLKRTSENKVYIDLLARKSSYSDSQCILNTTSDTKGINISGDLKQKPSRKSKNNEKNIFLNPEMAINERKKTFPEDKFVIDLPIIPYLYYLTKKCYRYFFNKDELVTEDEELDS
ncbi:MAG: hypothetical protein AB1782_04355, partial [Cyanobacteriota bacterium]